MAIELCSETSPRISFSHDLGQTDHVIPIDENKISRLDSLLLGSNSDFEFSINDTLEHQSSSADELFSNGVILPIQIHKKTAHSRPVHSCDHHQPSLYLPPRPQPSSYTTETLKKESLKEEEKPQSKTFWGFKRSTSLNCDNGHKKSLLCSLPLLSRSNSTGSVPNPKKTLKQNSQRSSPSIPMAKSASVSSTTSTSFYAYPLQQRLHVKKNYAGPYGQGVRISPVLNVPPPYISKSTANLFGFGSLFRNGKDKKSKK